jgi:UDP-glucose 4-epimerase
MNYFISGGLGFIGSNLVKRLLTHKTTEKVVVYDNEKSGLQAFLSSCLTDSRLRIVIGDIHQKQLLAESMREIDTVFHLAANPDISKAESEPTLDFHEGTELTQNMLEAARINKVQRFIFTSGSGVYGEVRDQVFSESYGPCFPISPYGAAKLGSEALISAYCHMFKMNGLAFRFANVVGPNQTHGVGYDFVRKLIADNKKLIVLGDGTQKKSYIYITDVLDAIEQVIGRQPNTIAFDIYNIATNDYVTVNEIADIAIESMGIQKNSLTIHHSGGDRGWNGDVPKVLFDTEKVRSLGWTNKYTSRDALTRSVQEMILNFTLKSA